MVAMPMPSRREFLRGTVASAASAAAVAVATTTNPATAATESSGPAGSPGDFAPGMALGPCRLVRVLRVDQGALPFVLADAHGSGGTEFVVELHLHDPGVTPLARAGSYDVFLRNGGTGRTPTVEAHGLGAMALASLVAAREAAGRPIPELATIVERWASAPPPTFR